MTRLPAVRVFRLLVALALAACAGGLPRPEGAPGAPAPEAAVERFLRLAAAGDYVQMGWVFGTSDGAIIERDPVPEVEQRMYALANILRHDTFMVGGGQSVPGRVGGAQRFTVQLLRGAERIPVPFTAVRGPDGRWFVEQVDLEAVTGRP